MEYRWCHAIFCSHDCKTPSSTAGRTCPSTAHSGTPDIKTKAISDKNNRNMGKPFQLRQQTQNWHLTWRAGVGRKSNIRIRTVAPIVTINCSRQSTALRGSGLDRKRLTISDSSSASLLTAISSGVIIPQVANPSRGSTLVIPAALTLPNRTGSCPSFYLFVRVC